MKLLSVFGLSVMLICSCTPVTNSITPVPPPKSYQVEYSVTGTAPHLYIFYDDATGGIYEIPVPCTTVPSLPWSTTLTITGGRAISLSAGYAGPFTATATPSSYGTITATLYVNGVLIQTSSASIISITTQTTTMTYANVSDYLQ
jgi:hypothetical protein